ncbi:tetratricopeptide repeat protein [Pseudoalteromonas piscicida]|uniref:tetratricopeptide repeat protein n=1 Tax=Pseudoalteromonas piscicida TaxID=43662 RepID=UPI00309CD95A
MLIVKQLFSLLLLLTPLTSQSSALLPTLDTVRQLLTDNPSAALEEIETLLNKQADPIYLSSAWFSLSLMKIEAHALLGHYDSAYEAIETLNQIIDDIKDPDAQGKLLLSHATVLLAQNRAGEAQEKLERALALTDPLQDERVNADIHDRLAHIYRFKADYSTALMHAKQAIEIAQRLDDTPRLASFYNQLGIIYDYMGQIEQAISFHEQSLMLQRQRDNQQGISNSLYNIGELYRDLEAFPLALSHFKQALQVDQQLGNPRHIANSYGKIGQVLCQQGQYEEARSFILKGLTLTKKMQADSDTAWQLSNLVNVQLALKDIDQAFESANEALALAINSGAHRTERSVRLALANVYLAQGKADEAKSQLELLLTQPQLGTQMQSDIHKQLAAIYQQAGLFEAALTQLKLYQQAQSELKKVSDKNRAYKMALNIEIVRKEQALSLLQKEQSLQQANLENLKLQRGLAVSIVLLLLAGLAIYLLRQRQKHKLEALEQHMTERALEQKNQLLADISHELRTPLTGLKLTIEAMQCNIEPDLDTAYKKVNSKIDQLDTLISDIYQSAQFDNNIMSLTLRPLDINALTRDCCTELTPIFTQKQQTLKCQLSTQALPIEGDPQRLKQVLLNLLRNSHFYSDSGGCCAVQTSVCGPFVVIKIEDSSPGVKTAELEQIFERLYRCEVSRSRDHGGSGLGLAISKHIVEAHHGEISASHSPLGGLLVEVRLPLKSAQNDTTHARSPL